MYAWRSHLHILTHSKRRASVRKLLSAHFDSWRKATFSTQTFVIVLLLGVGWPRLSYALQIRSRVDAALNNFPQIACLFFTEIGTRRAHWWYPIMRTRLTMPETTSRSTTSIRPAPPVDMIVTQTCQAVKTTVLQVAGMEAPESRKLVEMIQLLRCWT